MSELGALLTSHIPALLAMVLGFVLLVVEMYIPGFGLAGISGTVFMVVGIVAMSPTPMQALILVLISVALLAIAFAIAMRSLSKGRLSRSKLVLNDDLGSSEGEDLSGLVGKTGVAHTALRPAGIAEFDGVKRNVVSDGDFIEARQNVRVMSVEGSRITVRAEADNSSK